MVLASSGAVAPAMTEKILATVSSHDFRALGITSVAMVGLVEGIRALAHHGWLSSITARKLMHIGCGPLFLACWPLFSSSSSASSFAVIAPLTLTSYFAIVGLGLVKDERTVRSMSRSGKRGELLRAPMVYGAVICAASFLFWRKLTAVITIMTLCAGDGFADLVGRRYGEKHKIPWCRRKSYAGSLGFFVASFGFGTAFGLLFQHLGWAADVSTSSVLVRVGVASLAAAIVETLPIDEWDNLTVFATALASESLFCCARAKSSSDCRRALLTSAWRK